jgi:putative endonuclease
VPGFTARYDLNRLVYFEMTTDVRAAIAREKQIKGWLRSRKVALIESMNPKWDDLSAGWYDSPQGGVVSDFVAPSHPGSNWRGPAS